MQNSWLEMSQILSIGFPHLIGGQPHALDLLSILSAEIPLPYHHMMSNYFGYRVPSISMTVRALRPEQIPKPDIVTYIARATTFDHNTVEYYVTLDLDYNIIGWGAHHHATSNYLAQQPLNMQLRDQHKIPIAKEDSALDIGVHL